MDGVVIRPANRVLHENPFGLKQDALLAEYKIAHVQDRKNSE